MPGRLRSVSIGFESRRTSPVPVRRIGSTFAQGCDNNGDRLAIGPLWGFRGAARTSATTNALGPTSAKRFELAVLLRMSTKAVPRSV